MHQVSLPIFGQSNTSWSILGDGKTPGVTANFRAALHILALKCNLIQMLTLRFKKCHTASHSAVTPDVLNSVACGGNQSINQ